MSNAPSADFEQFSIGDLRFRLAPLTAIESLRVLAILQSVIFPIVGDMIKVSEKAGSIRAELGPNANADQIKSAIAENIDDADMRGLFEKAIGITDRLPEIYTAFANRCDVLQSGRFQPIATFDPFARNAPAMLCWIVECLIQEYRVFLAESGQNLLAEMGRKFTSLVG